VKKMLPEQPAGLLTENDDNGPIRGVLLVPGERIELPTNGLQNSAQA
jgi:hypothetical protein